MRTPKGSQGFEVFRGPPEAFKSQAFIVILGGKIMEKAPMLLNP